MNTHRSRLLARTLTAGAATVALAVALAGCGSVNQPGSETRSPDAATGGSEWTAPKGLEGSVTLYSANPQKLTDNLVAAFEEETGVTVEVFAGESGNIVARLDAEWTNPQADVVYLASWAPAAKYAEQGYALEYAPSTAEESREGWVSETDAFRGRDGSALGLITNTDVGESVPEDWEDLAGPEFKDKVIMPDPRESGTARDLITAMVEAWGEDKAWALFDSLFDNGMVVQGANGPALDAVTSGSYAVVVGGVDYSAYSAIKDGEPIEVVFPTSGTTITPRPVFITADAPNQDNARAFVDFLFSEQGQALSADANLLPADPRVPVADGTRTYDEVEQLTTDWDAIAERGAGTLAAFVERYLNS